MAILVLLIPISGCKEEKSFGEIRSGTEGISINFLLDSPPGKIHVEAGAENEFSVAMEVMNKGAYPQPGEGGGAGGLGPRFGKVFLSGYDPNIMTFHAQGANPGDLSSMSLEGKSSINPNGGQDILLFTGKIDTNKLNVEKYEPSLLATACYYYETVAGPSVCIDPTPYSTIKEKKVCTVNDIELAGQGAPIAVTRIDEEAFATKTQFRITFKNVGKGDAMRDDAARDKCDPLGRQKIDREDIDKIKLEFVRLATADLVCGPFTEGAVKGNNGIVRLIKGEGSVICELPASDYSNQISAYTTPLSIKLSYGYRVTAEKKMLIEKETDSSGRDDGSKTTTPPPPPSKTPPYSQDNVKWV